MANGIASEQLVIALGQQGILASFGAAGLVPSRIELQSKRFSRLCLMVLMRSMDPQP